MPLSRPEITRRYYERHRDRLRAQQKAPEARKANAERAARWRSSNVDRTREIGRRSDAKRDHASRAKRWRELNPEKRLAYNAGRAAEAAAIENKRKAAKLQATPVWADEEKIRAVYKEAARLGHDVDHIVPLRSPLVCGLHVQDNLRPLPAADNRAKRNRWWPDMFEESENLRSY
jgi:hypothetical protein